MLPRNYRFAIYNGTGQTLSASSVTVRGKKYKFDSTGALSYAGSESADYDNGSSQADGTYATGSAVDNSSDLYLGGHFEFEVTSPASAAGDVTCYLLVSTDGGTTWPISGGDQVVASLNMGGSQTDRVTFEL